MWLAPRGADAVAEALSAAPLASLGWGILARARRPGHRAWRSSISVLGLPLGLALFLSFGLWWLVGLTWAAWCAGRGLVRAPRGRMTALPRRLGDPRGRRVGADPERRRVDAGPGRSGSARWLVAVWRVTARDRALAAVTVEACGCRPTTRSKPGSPDAGGLSSRAGLHAHDHRGRLLAGRAAPAQHDRHEREREQRQQEHEVDIAAIDGRRTLRIELSTYTGHGEAFAVETNDEMIVLSRLRLNASSAPASTAGIISGSVILRNVCAGERVEVGRGLLQRLVQAGQPRADDQGDHRRREDRVADEEPDQPVVEEEVVGRERPAERSSASRTRSGARSRRRSRASRARGTAAPRKPIVHLPGRRASAMPASEPMTVAITAAPGAARIDVKIALRIVGLFERVACTALSPNSFQTTSARPSLNE